MSTRDRALPVPMPAPAPVPVVERFGILAVGGNLKWLEGGG
jgi:hypothetical protein